jgi:REP element-mobilizing transposase RayT
MRLNEWGEIARMEWLKTAVIRNEIELDEFVIMPNHIHAIVSIMDYGDEIVGATRRVAPTKTDSHADRGARVGKITIASKSIGSMIGQFKSITTKRINHRRGTPGAPVWQRNYWACPERLSRA